MDSESVAAEDVEDLEGDSGVDYYLPVLVEEVDALFGHRILLILIFLWVLIFGYMLSLLK